MLASNINAPPLTVQSSSQRDKLKEEAKPMVRRELGPLGDGEVEWFCGGLGLSRRYFTSVAASDVAKHTMLMFAAKFRARVSDSNLQLDIADEGDGQAIYICPSKDFGVKDTKALLDSASARIEDRIQSRYLDEVWSSSMQQPKAGQSAEASRSDQVQSKPGSEVAGSGYVVEDFRSAGEVAPNVPTKVRLYVVQRPSYPLVQKGDTSLRSIACTQFLHFIPPEHFGEYQELLDRAEHSNGCVVDYTIPAEEDWTEHSQHNEEQDIVLRVAHRRGTTHSFYSSCSALYRVLGLRSRVKAMWPFKNGVDMQAIWLYPSEALSYAELKAKVIALTHHISLSYILPSTSLTPLVSTQQLDAGQHAYAYCALMFAHHFLTLRPHEQDTAYAYKASLVPDMEAVQARMLKMRLRQHMLTEPRLADAVMRHPQIVKKLHAQFEKIHAPWSEFDPRKQAGGLMGCYDEALAKEIVRSVPNEVNQRVLLSFMDFNRYVLKTNFFNRDRNVLSFRLNPKCVDGEEFPVCPHGIFFVVGSVFRGFHIRFKDVARGGIRLIRSGNEQAYSTNAATLLEENYALAYTQQKKNKDIPEGGSKGTILLSLAHQDKGHVAFDQYIDGLLDLILPDKQMRDYLGKEEMLFFGPDEGTADKMDRAAQRARQRGYRLWKAATTGKSIAMGGIPHDTYGMTTRSVHQYVLGFYRKLELNESNISKVQTGGPDGDLGSNEILISKDRTVAIVDGSGVLYDPEGLHRDELNRLAHARQMVKHFNQKALGPQGYFVGVDEVDRKLPDGTLIPSGLLFRNTFHLNEKVQAELFVPCGGRPESINSSNVQRMFDKQNPRFKIIVEGANLFLTQPARQVLEAAGVHLVKDASANKGGVTSSSLEVLTALALEDSQYRELMTAPISTAPDKMPSFYQSYVREVQDRVEENARMEFECLYAEWLRTKRPMSELTDVISAKINNLNDAIQASALWQDIEFRKQVLSRYIPKTLLDHQGLDKLMKMVPESYLRSIFGAYLAAQYVYSRGPAASEFEFFNYITDFKYSTKSKM